MYDVQVQILNHLIRSGKRVGEYAGNRLDEKPRLLDKSDIRR